MIEPSKLTCRKARSGDLMMYYEWANDPEVRSNSFNSGDILLSEHQSWFERASNNPEYLMLVFEIEGASIGQIRFQIKGDRALLNYSIDKRFRGKHLSPPMIRMGTDELHRYFPEIKFIDAKVKNSNRASLQTLQNCGFRQVHSDSSETTLQLTFPDTNSTC